MIERKVAVESITIDKFSNLLVLLSLTLTEDGAQLSRANHRTAVNVDVSVTDQFTAVNAHLASMGWPAVSVSDLARLRRFHAIEGRG